MGNEIEINIENIGPVLVVRLKGRLDITRAEEFEKKILKEINNEARHIVVNLARVTYMSSSGIRALLALYRLAGSRNKKVCLCEASVVVQKVLDVVEVGQMLTSYGKEEEAVAALNKLP